MPHLSDPQTVRRQRFSPSQNCSIGHNHNLWSLSQCHLRKHLFGRELYVGGLREQSTCSFLFVCLQFFSPKPFMKHLLNLDSTAVMCISGYFVKQAFQAFLESHAHCCSSLIYTRQGWAQPFHFFVTYLVLVKELMIQSLNLNIFFSIPTVIQSSTLTPVESRSACLWPLGQML